MWRHLRGVDLHGVVKGKVAKARKQTGGYGRAPVRGVGQHQCTDADHGTAHDDQALLAEAANQRAAMAM